MICATYFDGRTARSHPVELSTRDGAIALAGPSVTKTYAAGEARLAEPFADAPALLYFADGGCCEVTGHEARRQLAGALGYRKSRVVRWQERWYAALFALLLLAATIGATAIWGVPAAAERIAQALPPSVDAALGKSAIAALEAQNVIGPSRLSDQRLEQVQQVLRRVLPARPRIAVHLRVADAREFGPNALALPDGTIIVTDSMIRYILGKGDSFDAYRTAQLAGVLAHEIGHLERRHAARLMARSSLAAALSAALFGDFSAVAAGLPAVLINMEYSRAMETEADGYAIALLRQNGLPSAPLADLFEALDEDSAGDDGNAPDWLAQGVGYLSSHPATSARIKRLRRTAAR